jgi:hypothetical protein
MMILTKTQVIEMIIDIIEAKTYLRKKDGYYYDELYADYTDDIDSDTMRKFFDNDNPQDAFYELINDGYFYAELETQESTVKLVEKYLNEVNEDIFAEHGDFIIEWLQDHVYFEYPYKHYLNQDVCINILVDAGDANYDYTLNNLFNWYRNQDIDMADLKESSLVWLMKQQGYTHDEITDFIVNYNTQNSKFLESIQQESANCSSSMSALTFFVKMTLEEAFELHDLLKAKTGEAIVLGKDTACGLYDPWGGAGGVLEIELEKDVVLPIKLIDSALPDGGRGYSIREIYGLCLSFWTQNKFWLNGKINAFLNEGVYSA